MCIRDRNEIAPCRTFCFLHELEALYKQNLIKGGDLTNAIVIVDRQVKEGELDYLAELLDKPKVSVDESRGILNNVDLHFPNEMARHKLLDLVGDLALVGRPLKAQIMAARPGHAANVAPVSYTHLDVYKRQGDGWVPGCVFLHWPPVSYWGSGHHLPPCLHRRQRPHW